MIAESWRSNEAVEVSLLSMATLISFSLASVGFLVFMFRYPRGSDEQRWGLRACHLLGFGGVILMWVWHGQVTEIVLFILASLTVSLVSFELTMKYLK